MMEPDVLHRREGIQLSFAIPHRINHSQIYPRKAPNGSTIIICAHEQGLRVIWYAGKKLKQNKGPKVNGDSIDLTGDDDLNLPEYEDDEEEIDSARPFHGIVTYSDYAFGTAVTKIAVPPLSSESTGDLHQITTTHAIILAACSDLSVRLVAVPLAPAPTQDGEVQQLSINGANSHQDLISDISITLTANTLEGDEPNINKHRSRSKGRSTEEVNTASADSRDWSLLLASTSPTGTGLLLIHQIPIAQDGRFSEDAEDQIPVRRQFLRCPLARCSIQFNPSVYPSHRHSNLLVASFDGAITKICKALPQTTSVKKRRGSAATTDSTASTGQASKRIVSNDKILLDLLPPFNNRSEGLAPARKRILDAKWLLHGRSIIVLLEDGEWGVWDLEGASPSNSASTGKLMQGQMSASGVQGGSLTKFAIRGDVVARNKSTQTNSSSKTTVSDNSLAPMTPHTRKTRSQGFFKGQNPSVVTSDVNSVQIGTGGIAISAQPADIANSKMQDESIILSYGSTNTFIGSIQSYWRSEDNSQGIFDSSGTAKYITLPQLQTASENAQNIQLLPQNLPAATSGFLPATKVTPNFLATTSSRLILFVTPLTESTSQSEPQKHSLPVRNLMGSSMTQDQMLLDSGELDVDGMDRILDSMATSGTMAGSSQNPSGLGFGRKSVGFQLDDDEDTEMGTPTAAKTSKSRLTVNDNLTRANGRTKLFA